MLILTPTDVAFIRGEGTTFTRAILLFSDGNEVGQWCRGLKDPLAKTNNARVQHRRLTIHPEWKAEFKTAVAIIRTVLRPISALQRLPKERLDAVMAHLFEEFEAKRIVFGAGPLCADLVFFQNEADAMMFKLRFG